MRDKAFILLLVTVIVIATESIWVINALPCAQNEITVKDTDQCIPCVSCPEGQELYPQCGSQITVQEIGNIKCKNCKPGYFSDEYDIYPCKECHNCSNNQIVIKKCTNTSDAICRKSCNKSYYFKNSSLDCERCSCCCGDSKDVKIKKCISDGEPESNQCSSHRKQECCKATPQSTVASEQPTKNLVVEPLSGAEIAWIVVGILAFLFISFLIGVILIRRYRRRSGMNAVELPEMQIDRIQQIRQSSSSYDVSTPATPSERIRTVLHKTDSWLLGIDTDGKMLERQVNTESYSSGHVFKLGDLNGVQRERIGKILDYQPYGVGSTKELAAMYGMDKYTTEKMLKKSNPAEQLLNYIHATSPNTTVYKLCEDLQRIGRNDIVKQLCSYLDKVDQELASSSKKEKSNV